MTPRSRSEKPPASERRSNRSLRETLDELVDHVRLVARTAATMRSDEVDYAQQRLEWLADEIWRLAVEGDDEG
ncbi:MAG TPA: hypothetical protein VGA37_17045 [Gemmatimonadales bacterium]